MKRIILIASCLAAFALHSFAQIKPVTGTFLNFFWQDERNNYMNRRSMDQTDPLLWETKVREMHQMGVDYLALLAVANEGQAIYPSTFMKWAYPEGRKSPVDAIMDTADELGMHVLLSTGWARDQLDDLSDPYVVETQHKIMKELAALYGERSSFYGWYLPVEGCFIPYLQDIAVEGLNHVAGQARELTPGAKILISPFGIFAGDFDDPRFAEQIAKLDVDIIAHQDEIGCIREPYPMDNLRKHLKLLGEIHRNCGIEFWVNVESFTWDRPANNWYSSLIPASFGRFLSQIVAASEAGADRIISFSMCGIFDKPGSAYPVGQPVLSNEAYENYMSWLGGDRRWKILEDMIHGGCASENPADPRWVKYPDGIMESVVDLGSKTHIGSVCARFLSSRKDDIVIPQSFQVLVSDNGRCFKSVKTVAFRDWPNNLHDCWTDVILADDLDVRARYVKVVAVADRGTVYSEGIKINL
ncbi:MAG: DUF4434 domain-containing protein [Bacteroidales bacterium]|nr:DUF4434 domain-containing protein [Bacteroidales bacterium]